MKRSIQGVALAALLLILSAPSNVNAQVRVGAHAGINTEGSDLFLGASTQFGMTVQERAIWGAVGLDIYPFIENVFMTRFTVNALMPFLAASGIQFYGGGGVLIQFQSIDVPEGLNIDDKDSDVALNAVLGMIWAPIGDVRPFVEFAQTIGAGTDLAVRAGVYYPIGK